MSACIFVLLLIDRYTTIHSTARFSFPASLFYIPSKRHGTPSLSAWVYFGIMCLSLAVFARFIYGIMQKSKIANTSFFWRPTTIFMTATIITICSILILFFRPAPLVINIHTVAMITLLVQSWFWGVRFSRDRNYLNYRIKPLKLWVMIGLALWLIEIIVNTWANRQYTSIVCQSKDICTHLDSSWQILKYIFNNNSQISISADSNTISLFAKNILETLNSVSSYIYSLYLFAVIMLMCCKKRYKSINYYGWIFLTLLIAELFIASGHPHSPLPIWEEMLQASGAIILFITWVDLLFYLYNIPKQNLQGRNIAKHS